MDLQKIKDELKEMYPEIQNFIQHTLVAEMCLKWHEKQMKKCSTPDIVGRSEQLVAFLEWYDSNVCQNDFRSRQDLVKDFLNQ